MCTAPNNRIGALGFAGLGLILLPIFWLLWVSYRYDWDLFNSLAFADLAGWLDSGRIPQWSYYLCGGAPRISDPQSLAGSPLFLLVYLCGAVWGTKLVSLFCFAYGIYFLYQLLALFSGGEASLKPWERSALVATFFLSEYFLWRILVGHVPFFAMGLAFGVVYWCVYAARNSLRVREWLYAALAGWLYFSGGFHHSFIYFLAPVLLCLSIVLAAQSVFTLFRKGEGQAGRALLRVALIFTIMLAPSAYRWIPVLRYQQEHPRTIDQSWDYQPKLAPFIAFQLLPTFAPESLAPQKLTESASRPVGPLGVWEDAAFSTAPWLVIALLALHGIYRRRGSLGSDSLLLPLSLVLLVLSCALSLGRFASWAPFSLLNLVLHDAVRLSQRFTPAFIFGLILLAQQLLQCGRIPALTRKSLMGGAGAGMLLSAAIFCVIRFPHHLEKDLKAASETRPLVREIRELTVAKSLNNPMLAVLQGGSALLSCYQALAIYSQPAELIRQTQSRMQQSKEKYTKFSFVVNPESVPESCREGSFLRPGSLQIDPSCPPGTCFLIGWVNPDEEISSRLMPAGEYYCLKG